MIWQVLLRVQSEAADKEDMSQLDPLFPVPGVGRVIRTLPVNNVAIIFRPNGYVERARFDVRGHLEEGHIEETSCLVRIRKLQVTAA